MKELEIYKNMINEDGGITIKGQQYQIELVVEDGQSTVEGCATACNRLVYDEKVSFFLGPSAFFSVAASPIADPNKVLHVLVHCSGIPGEMGPDVPYGFLADGGILSHFDATAEFLDKNYPEVKSVAVIIPAGAVSDPMKEGLAQTLDARGMTQVGEWVEFGDDVVDFNPYCTKLNSLDADAVLMPAGSLDHLKNVGKGLRALGNTKPIGVEVWGDYEAFVDFIGEEGSNDMIYRCVQDHPDNTPLLTELLANVRAEHGDVNCFFEFCTTLNVLVNMMEIAQTLDPTELKEVWENTDEVETLFGTGTICGDEYFGIKHHAVSMPEGIEFIKDGKRTFGWYGGNPIP
jgi:branched-chain amino acid transport system substrate-binding protein